MSGEIDGTYVNAYNEPFYDHFEVLTGFIFTGEGGVASRNIYPINESSVPDQSRKFPIASQFRDYSVTAHFAPTKT